MRKICFTADVTAEILKIKNCSVGNCSSIYYRTIPKGSRDRGCFTFIRIWTSAKPRPMIMPWARSSQHRWFCEISPKNSTCFKNLCYIRKYDVLSPILCFTWKYNVFSRKCCYIQKRNMPELMFFTKMCNGKIYVTHEYEMCSSRIYVTYEM